jgi:hypothetical protein
VVADDAVEGGQHRLACGRRGVRAGGGSARRHPRVDVRHGVDPRPARAPGDAAASARADERRHARTPP